MRAEGNGGRRGGGEGEQQQQNAGWNCTSDGRRGYRMQSSDDAEVAKNLIRSAGDDVQSRLCHPRVFLQAPDLKQKQGSCRKED
jgi:hypothetical protein